MKIILAGTPEFSVRSFEEVINHFDVVGIITQPDRPKGRGQKVIETPVKQLAKRYGIKTFQPEKISEIYEELKDMDFDILLTCAYGQYIPQRILDLPKIAALNIHGSLLPKYRGAAPIHYSILNGDEETGITLMYMVKEMDAGDMIFKASTPIEEGYTTGLMFGILSMIAADHITEWLNNIEKGLFNRYPQAKEEVSFSPKITKEECEITSEKTIFESQRMIKAFNPFPGAFIMRDGKKFKILNYSNNQEGIEFKVKDGSIYITELQAPGKKALPYKEFLKGSEF
ncbi:methionyl-tRNA formyltransferase [Mycoplasma todarodis]|uniref:Methionyl-tRNA formyltransferase n=1 Tax=Mycoplasma todarodis TaxID=1937191 RepID=A0A4R0XT83_9MOLU|nr:methionyl-tRNA formyltransferase [Mycoplasma todarodis]TCG11680.1 methionyl-tRNA formyltransferase [Mycoplasma todarodis]